MNNKESIKSNISEQALKDLLLRFLKSYEQKSKETTDEEWLREQLQKELPDKDHKDILKMAKEIVDSISLYSTQLKELNESCEKGQSKEKWLSKKFQDMAVGVSVNEFGNYLKGIDNSIDLANQQMLRTVLKNDGAVSLNQNLDGFIAEQYHVNQFNLEATLQKSDYRARVCVPKDGVYTKNSFDTVIENVKTGESVHHYQFKFGKDAKSTINYIKNGNYNNQRIVVPAEQVAEVQAAFPGKSITAVMGDTDKTAIASKALSKSSAKELQLEYQKGVKWTENNWNTFSTKELTMSIGKGAAKAGLWAAVLDSAFHVGADLIKKEPVDKSELVENSLKTGADAGLKSVVAGTLKVASEKGIIAMIPKGTPAGIVANIACVSVENLKILYHVAKGDITVSEAMEKMQRTTITMVSGLACAAKGAALGAAALHWIPIAGSFIGGVVGGILGYAAGAKIGDKIAEGYRKVKNVVKTKFKNLGNTIKEKLSLRRLRRY